MSVEQVNRWIGGKDQRIYSNKMSANIYDYLDSHSGLDKDKCDLIAVNVFLFRDAIKEIMQVIEAEELRIKKLEKVV